MVPHRMPLPVLICTACRPPRMLQLGGAVWWGLWQHCLHLLEIDTYRIQGNMHGRDQNVMLWLRVSSGLTAAYVAGGVHCCRYLRFKPTAAGAVTWVSPSLQSIDAFTGSIMAGGSLGRRRG